VSDLTVGRPVGATVEPPWWIFLVTGGLWLLFAVILFRFDWSSVSSIAILFGLAMLAVAVMEVVAAAAVAGGWRLAHAALATAAAIVGIASFLHPGQTFSALAAVMSFYFVLRGGFDIVIALLGRVADDLWWLGLLVGLVELLVGFWAAGYFGRSAVLLVAWVGALALTRAVTEFMLAFRLRREYQPA